MVPKLQAFQIRSFFLAIIAGLLGIQILFLTPGKLEEVGSSSVKPALEPAKILKSISNDGKALAPGIPSDRIPEYSIDGFNYLSSKSGIKQWKLLAQKAYLYNIEKLVHARTVTAYLYNSAGGEPTLVTGTEARYFMNQRDLEIYGNVVTTFPDGFKVYSDYMRYQPNEGRVLIPESWPVRGEGDMEKEKDKHIQFTSLGMQFEMKENWIYLPKDVVFNQIRTTPPTPETAGVAEKTTILSDHCLIERDKKIAHFTMNPKLDLTKRFVRVTQPTLFVRGRKVDLNYGDFPDVLRYMIAYDDVYIRETGDTGSARYGTSGQADFDTKQNIIIMQKFPQVYQDHDTVTGDIIIIHRDTDIVEVEHSNAFSDGS